MASAASQVSSTADHAQSPSSTASSNSGGSKSRRRRQRRRRKQNKQGANDINTNGRGGPAAATGSRSSGRFDGHRLRNLLRTHTNSSVKLDRERDRQWKKPLLSPQSSADPSSSFSSSSPSFPKESMLNVVLKTSPPNNSVGGGVSCSGSAAAAAALLPSPSSATTSSIVALPIPAGLDGKYNQQHWTSRRKAALPLSYQADPSSLAAVAELARRYAPRDATIVGAGGSRRHALVGPFGGISTTATTFGGGGTAFASSSPSSATDSNQMYTSKEIYGDDSPASNSTLPDDEAQEGEIDRPKATDDALKKEEQTAGSVNSNSVGRIQSLSNLLRMSFARRKTSVAVHVQTEAQLLTDKKMDIVVTTTPDTVDDNEELSMESLPSPRNVNSTDIQGGGGEPSSLRLYQPIEIDRAAFTRGADFILQLGHILGRTCSLTTPIQNRPSRHQMQQTNEQDNQSTTSSLSSIAPRMIVPVEALPTGEREEESTVQPTVISKRRRASILCLVLVMLLLTTGAFMIGLDVVIALGTIMMRKGIVQAMGGDCSTTMEPILSQSTPITTPNDELIEEEDEVLASIVSIEKEHEEISDAYDILSVSMSQSPPTATSTSNRNSIEEDEASASYDTNRMSLTALDDEPVPVTALVSQNLNASMVFGDFIEENLNEEALATESSLPVEENAREDDEEEMLEMCLEPCDFATATHNEELRGNELEATQIAQTKLYEEYVSLQTILEAIYALSATKASAIIRSNQWKPRPKETKSSTTNVHQQHVLWKPAPFIPSLNASLGVSVGGGAETSRALVPVHVPTTDALIPAYMDLSPAELGPVQEDFSDLYYRGFRFNAYDRLDHIDPSSAMFDKPLSQFLTEMIKDYHNQKKQKKLLRLESGDRGTGEAKGRKPLRRLSDWLKQSLPLARYSSIKQKRG